MFYCIKHVHHEDDDFPSEHRFPLQKHWTPFQVHTLKIWINQLETCALDSYNVVM